MVDGIPRVTVGVDLWNFPVIMMRTPWMLSQATGTTTTFTAPDVGSTCTITAGISNASQQASMITFTVIPPNGAAFTASNPFYHDKTIPSAGFTAKPIVIQPTTVSFYNIEVREGTGKAVANGVFLHLNGKKHKKGDYLSIGQDNTILPPGIDEVAIYGSTEGVQNGNYSGTLTWPIAQLYRQVKSKDKGVDYTTLTCNTVSDQSGTTTTSKGGATKTFKRNDPTTP
jgi:hypothetical protein